DAVPSTTATATSRALVSQKIRHASSNKPPGTAANHRSRVHSFTVILSSFPAQPAAQMMSTMSAGSGDTETTRVGITRYTPSAASSSCSPDSSPSTSTNTNVERKSASNPQ